MKKVIYKCNLPCKNRPEWVRCIISALNNLYSYPMNGDLADFQNIKGSIDRLIFNMKIGLNIKSKITTEIVEDNGGIVIFIKRTGYILISVYIK